MDTDSPAQLAAVRVLQAVLRQHRSLNDALAPALDGLAVRERALAAQLAYGTLRWHGRLQAVLGQLLKTRLRRRDEDLAHLLLVALYELEYLAAPDYAVVDRSVGASRALGKAWASRLVNGVLRSFLRRRDELLRQADAVEHQRLALPPWLLESWQNDWPAQWRELATASNERAPMTLRVNRARSEPARARAELAEAGIEASAHRLAPDALVLAEPVDVARLPGFGEGRLSVQDAGAQLAAPLLQLAPGQRVLDACAAPGGKTCHIGEQQPQLAALLALEVDTARCQRLGENLARCGVAGEAKVADAAEPQSWWDGLKFDRILLDAPCSASGVIRRHPDIKHLRRASDLPAMARQQGRLLDALWPMLAANGILLYATCSVSREENESVLADFLRRCPAAVEEAIEADWGEACPHGRQLLPGSDGMDGFYYARLRNTRG